jgi:hypothetical protein
VESTIRCRIDISSRSTTAKQNVPRVFSIPFSRRGKKRVRANEHARAGTGSDREEEGKDRRNRESRLPPKRRGSFINKKSLTSLNSQADFLVEMDVGR